MLEESVEIFQISNSPRFNASRLEGKKIVEIPLLVLNESNGVQFLLRLGSRKARSDTGGTKLLLCDSFGYIVSCWQPLVHERMAEHV